MNGTDEPTDHLATDSQRQTPTWSCPVCGREVDHPHRPGRARVYCTNACRQKAYRWRCRHRSRLRVPSPPQRARTYERTHALRCDDDFVTPLSDPQGRRVTACGTFARAARDDPQLHHHVWFYAYTDIDHRTGAVTTPSSTCQRCVGILGIEARPIGVVLAEIDRARPRRRSVEYSRNETES